uniref:Uncharacterized protein n=1 Tax=Esox lucius TaxID=8010 RepID=A0A3P9AEA0_ESOLU
MPICSVMWSQVPGVPRAMSLALSWSLINRTRSAMVFTFPFLQDGWRGRRGITLLVMATIRAPWEGGLDHVRPKFLEKDWAQNSSKPWDTKYRMAQASLSRFPEAKPW